MGLLDTLMSGLAPTIAGLTEQFGVTLTVYRSTAALNAKGEPIRTYAADAALTAVSGFFAPGTSEVSTPNATNLRPFGGVSELRARISLPRINGVLPVLDQFDGVKVLSGPYAGYTFLCDADSAPDAVGAFTVTVLASAPAGVIP